MSAFSVNKTSRRIREFAICSLLVIGILAAPLASAADADKKFSLSVGAFITDWDTQTRVDVSGTPDGTPVDGQSDLGFDNSDSVLRVDGYFKFNDRNRIDFNYFDLSQSSSKAIERDITWNGTVYPIDTTVFAELDFTIYKVAYTYSFMVREKGYIGASAGVYVADLGANLYTEANPQRDGGDVTAPLPVIGMRGAYDLSEKWTFRAYGDFFFLKVGDFDGSLVDLYAGFDYQAFNNVAFGAGYNSVRLDIGVDSSDLNGDLEWKYDGILLFVKFDF